jgi:hypothetical protein
MTRKTSSHVSLHGLCIRIRRRRISLRFALLLSAPVVLLAIGCGVGATAGGDSPLNQQQAEASTGVVGAQFFGMVVKTAQSQPAVAVGSRRLWDAGVTWAALEPNPGSFEWQALDAEVGAARQQGQQVVLTLGMTPAWASSQPELVSAYGDGATAMPARLADWDAYVTAVATRYAGRIAAYEVWNAPESSAFWTGDAGALGANMAELAADADACVHRADSSALVVSPAFSARGLADFLSAGGGGSVDAVATALNSPGLPPEASVAALQSLRAAMEGSAAADKPVWNEQSAWTLPAGGLNAESQAAWVARALLLNAGFGVARMHWYAWDSGAAGSLALTDGALPTRAALAYGVVENWLAGSTINGCSSTAEGLWTCQLVIGGRTAWVVWSPGGPAESSTYGASKEHNLSGNVTGIGTQETVTVGESPVLLQ